MHINGKGFDFHLFCICSLLLWRVQANSRFQDTALGGHNEIVSAIEHFFNNNFNLNCTLVQCPWYGFGSTVSTLVLNMCTLQTFYWDFWLALFSFRSKTKLNCKLICIYKYVVFYLPKDHWHYWNLKGFKYGYFILHLKVDSQNSCKTHQHLHFSLHPRQETMSKKSIFLWDKDENLNHVLNNSISHEFWNCASRLLWSPTDVFF